MSKIVRLPLRIIVILGFQVKIIVKR